MEKKAIIIGAGLSGLTAAALMAKKGIGVTVLDSQYQPGGGCGIFKRGPYTFDQGVGMFYGFGERGFNPHRYVMDILEEPIEMVRHRALYSLNYRGKRIVFWPDMERFYEELGKLLPESLPRIKEFYAHIIDLYDNVISKTVVFTSPSEMPRSFLLAQLLRHPIRQMRLLRLLNRSAAYLFRKFVNDPEAEAFFNKLTSTYSYTTLEETPAIMAITMFVDNHKGGSYYPVGGSAAVPARLEHAIEKYGCRIEYETLVTGILFEGGRAVGVRTAAGRELRADAVLYSGTIWNLYGRLLPSGMDMGAEDDRFRAMEATYPSMVVYGAVDASVIPPGTLPVEMLASAEAGIDETEVTVYIPTLDDPSLAPRGQHLFLAIGPSLLIWPAPGSPEYNGKIRSSGYAAEKKGQEKRVLDLMDERFPGIVRALRYVETATPATIERYLLKNGGAVAGPKQRIGQELLNRPHARTRWPGLFLCGESTVMGTGTPAVTVSGISAANVILRDFGIPEYSGPSEKTGFVTYRDSDKEPLRYAVNEFSADPTSPGDNGFSFDSKTPRAPQGKGGGPDSIPALASLCLWCDDGPCRIACPAGGDIRGIMRRLQYGNLTGSRRRLIETIGHACEGCRARPCEAVCRSGGRLPAGGRVIEAGAGAGSKPGAGIVHPDRKGDEFVHLPIREIMLRLLELPVDPAGGPGENLRGHRRRHRRPCRGRLPGQGRSPGHRIRGSGSGRRIRGILSEGGDSRSTWERGPRRIPPPCSPCSGSSGSGTRSVSCRTRTALEWKAAAYRNGEPWESVFSLFIAVERDSAEYRRIAPPHLIYAPDHRGSDPHGIFSVDFYRRASMEISIPCLRDPSLAPPGGTGMIVSSPAWPGSFDGWAGGSGPGHEQRKDSIADILVDTASPFTMERRTGNSGGSFSGWAYTDPDSPAERSFLRMPRAVSSPVRGLFRAGQWLFTPTGIPVSIMTGKLSALAAVRYLRGRKERPTVHPLPPRSDAGNNLRHWRNDPILNSTGRKTPCPRNRKSDAPVRQAAR